MRNTSDTAVVNARLREIERRHAQLFASLVELRIQLSILNDQHEEMHCRNQQLRAIGAFVATSMYETDLVPRIAKAK